MRKYKNVNPEYFNYIDSGKLSNIIHYINELNEISKTFSNIQRHCEIEFQLLRLGFVKFAPNAYNISSNSYYKNTKLGLLIKKSYFQHKEGKFENKLPTLFICHAETRFYWVIQPLVKITKASQNKARKILACVPYNKQSPDLKESNVCMWNNEACYLDW